MYNLCKKFKIGNVLMFIFFTKINLLKLYKYETIARVIFEKFKYLSKLYSFI